MNVKIIAIQKALLSTLTIFAQLPPEVKEASTKMLEIMSWITNDVDWITGECHESVKRLAWHTS